MSTSDCQVFFKAGDPQVPASFRETFAELSRRAGRADEVDSCDLLSFYQTEKASSRYHLVRREDFLTEIEQGSQRKVAFSFERLFGHLLLVKKGLPRVRDMIAAKDEGDIKKWGENNFQILWEAVPSSKRSPALANALRRLCLDFPYRGVLDTCEGEECTQGKKRVTGFMGVSLDSEWAVAMMAANPLIGYRAIFLREDGSFTTTEVDLKGESYVKRYAKNGMELGWIHVDLTPIFRTDTNPFGVPDYFYGAHINPATKDDGKKIWDAVSVPVMFNMTGEQWKIAAECKDSWVLPFIENFLAKQEPENSPSKKQ